MANELFNNEEKVLINGICKNEKLSALTKADVLNSLSFSRQICEDGMMADLIDGAIEKVNALTDHEWDELKFRTPFPVAQTAEAEVSEVPLDEDVTV